MCSVLARAPAKLGQKRPLLSRFDRKESSGGAAIGGLLDVVTVNLDFLDT